MNDLESLLRAVLCDPDDDAPRLIYADALEEIAGEVQCETCEGHGQYQQFHGMGGADFDLVDCIHCHGTGRMSDGRRERAEFIRVQCELEPLRMHGHGFHNPQGKHCEECERVAQLEHREKELAKRYAVDWFAVGVGPSNVSWSRGFVHHIELHCEAFMRHAKEIFEREPVTEVRISSGLPIHPSGGNDTYYVGGLGVFPPTYWRRLENHRTQSGARQAISDVCVDHGRELAGLPAL